MRVIVKLATTFALLLITVIVISPPQATAGDGTEEVPYKTLLSRNLANLNKLSVGMSKSEVMSIMGSFSAETRDALVPNPYTIEPFTVGKSQYETLYYLIHKYPMFTPIKISQATPVVLRDGRVVGWGEGSLQDAKAGKFESSSP